MPGFCIGHRYQGHHRLFHRHKACQSYFLHSAPGGRAGNLCARLRRGFACGIGINPCAAGTRCAPIRASIGGPPCHSPGLHFVMAFAFSLWRRSGFFKAPCVPSTFTFHRAGKSHAKIKPRREGYPCINGIAGGNSWRLKERSVCLKAVLPGFRSPARVSDCGNQQPGLERRQPFYMSLTFSMKVAASII
jgi:hypothetical protein